MNMKWIALADVKSAVKFFSTLAELGRGRKIVWNLWNDHSKKTLFYIVGPEYILLS